MHQDTPRAVSRSALSFFSGTFLSRLTGMFRDMSMAFCFGSNPAIAAFMVAYRFANLFRRLIGEGPLPSGFIPHFESLRQTSPEQGARFFRDLFFSLFLFLGVVLFFVEGGLFAWYLFGQMTDSTKEILYLTLLMLPGVLFICLYGVSSALLQCEKSFFLPGFAPVAFNIVWVGAVFAFRDQLPPIAMIGLSFAVIAGFFLQWFLLVPKMSAYLKQFLSWKEIFQFQFFSADVRKIVKPFLLGIIGIGATQVNSALDAIFARYASLEGPAYLWYAIRIEQLPLALFGIALSSALLPPLSRALCDNNWDKYRELLGFAFKRSFSFIFPCTFALFLLAASGVNLLYGRGDFSLEATRQTILCLWGYGIGLLPSVFVLLLAPAFYAQKNFRLPMIAAILSVALNIILNYMFVFWFAWGALSVALATSACAFFNFIFLSVALSKKIGSLFTPSLIKSCMKTAMCTLIATAMTLALGYFLVGDPSISIFLGQADPAFSRQFFQQALQFFVLAGFFLLTFISYAWMLDVEDILDLLGIRKRNRLYEN
jgi:putative peptidoglycan lipid II flippase